ncbi:MAG: mechanosensitive ion channel family protein [Opitutaceae bacterium]
MKRFVVLFLCVLGWAIFAPGSFAADAAPAPGSTAPAGSEAEKMKVAAAAATAVEATREVHTPDFLEHLVDVVLELFDVRSSGNTATHYIISVSLLIAGLLTRRIVSGVLFGLSRRIAARTQTILDDKLFAALEPPVGAIVMLVGIFAALKVLKLSPTADAMVAYSSTVAFSIAIFWFLVRALSTVLDHAHALALAQHKGIAAFMPWIKKTIIAVFMVLGVLMVIQSLGYNVRAILAGLGLGGLAFALAAQDTLANVFGSIVIAIDQPFRIGEFVQIGPNSGAVEDIGLRSTKLRRADKALIIVPNKTVAAEAVVNLARFTRRRAEQVIALTYGTKPDQMEGIVQEIRGLIVAQPEVDENSVMVFFRDLNASSLDIWIVYETPDPDFQKHMTVRQRINLAIMRAVERRGLAFAFPTQTIELAGSVAERMADGRARDANPPRHG